MPDYCRILSGPLRGSRSTAWPILDDAARRRIRRVRRQFEALRPRRVHLTRQIDGRGYRSRGSRRGARRSRRKRDALRPCLPCEQIPGARSCRLDSARRLAFDGKHRRRAASDRDRARSSCGFGLGTRRLWRRHRHQRLLVAAARSRVHARVQGLRRKDGASRRGNESAV